MRLRTALTVTVGAGSGLAAAQASRSARIISASVVMVCFLSVSGLGGKPQQLIPLAGGQPRISFDLLQQRGSGAVAADLGVGLGLADRLGAVESTKVPAHRNRP